MLTIFGMILVLFVELVVPFLPAAIFVFLLFRGIWKRGGE